MIYHHQIALKDVRSGMGAMKASLFPSCLVMMLAKKSSFVSTTVLYLRVTFLAKCEPTKSLL